MTCAVSTTMDKWVFFLSLSCGYLDVVALYLHSLSSRCEALSSWPDSSIGQLNGSFITSLGLETADIQRKSFNHLQGLRCTQLLAKNCLMPTPSPSNFKVSIQHSGSSNIPLQLKNLSARVIWMCSAYFHNSYLGTLAWSSTSVPSLSVAYQFFYACCDYCWSFHCPSVKGTLVFVSLVTSLHRVSPV